MIAPNAIRLYDFQARGLDAGRALYKGGARAVLFVGPTGMGKTTLAGAAAVGRVARGGRVAAFAHRRELVDQLVARFEAMGLEVGAKGRRPNARVQVDSVQAVLARRQIPEADFVILDEAHHYVSDEWAIVPRTYLARGAFLMGLTATPERDDGRGLGGDGGIFDGIVVVAQVRDLVELHAREPDKGITPIDVIEPLLHVRALAQAPVEAYLQETPGRSAVVFAPNVQTAHVFVADFRARGVDADIVHGELASEARGEALQRFARGDLRVLVNVAVLTEGWDAPICDTCILARKIGSISLFYQCVGRARRPFPGKERATLLDLSGNVALHCHPDTELVYSLEGAGVEAAGKAGIVGPRICRSCRRVLDADLEADPELEACPECDTPISKIRVPTPEEVELGRVQRDEARARAPEDTKTRALCTLYAKGLRAGSKRIAAEMAFRRMFSRFPSTEARVVAWREAVALIGEEKGDAWSPNEDEARERAAE